MKTVGIIAEYNPFHTGHAYHIQKAREKAGADFVLVVMSPDFVQRGEPAVLDKYTRTRMALLCGADLVLELPVCYASGSAEYFAEGAAALLDQLGVTDSLCFGAETNDPDLFCQTAQILSDEPPLYRSTLQKHLKNGLTFPEARSAALKEYLSFSDHTVFADSLHSFLETPNNLLGAEYCKALQKRKSPISILPIHRISSDYRSTSLEGDFCSATALRHAMHTQPDAEAFSSYIPDSCLELFQNSRSFCISKEDLLAFLQLRLLDRNTYDDILDISEDLSDRIYKLRFSCIGKSYQECISLLKTRQMTEARIRRALLHLILNIRTLDAEAFRSSGTIFYAHVLGFRKTAAPLLHAIKQNSAIPLITKPAHAANLLAKPADSMWEQDLYASHLYRTMQSTRYRLPFCTEYEQSPVILP